MHFYASTDIKKGDEIRADYSDFVEEDGWKYLGL
jgi:SET domain-containing protein